MASVLWYTNHSKMQIIGPYLLLFVVTGYHSFFIDNKDIKKLLQLFPKAFDIDPSPKLIRPLHYRRRDNDYRHRDEYVQDYDRYDNGDSYKNTARSSKGKLSGRDSRRFHHHSHECDHPDHYHHHNKFTDEREKYNDEMNEYEKKSQHKKKVESEKGEEKEKKDYIKGVLIAIPKGQKDEDLESYYKDSKHSFIQQLLKAEHDDHHEEADDDIRSYLY